MARRSRWTAILGITALLLVGCTSGPTVADSETLDAIFELLATEGAPGLADSLTADQRRCLVDDIVASQGDLEWFDTEDGRFELILAAYHCVPALADSDEFLDRMTRAFGRSLGLEPRPRSATCLADHILEWGGSYDEDDVLLATEECLPRGFFDEAAKNHPASLGDDPLVDELHAACGTGHGAACDLLFLESRPGSELEAFALDCGGRVERHEGASCVPGLFYDHRGTLDVEAPAVSALVDGCLDGDMIECDLLDTTAPIGSPEEDLGHTCGGRVPLGIGSSSCRVEGT